MDNRGRSNKGRINPKVNSIEEENAYLKAENAILRELLVNKKKVHLK